MSSAQVTEKPLESSGEKSIRVLHVDDEPEVAELAATFLERTDDAIEVSISTSPKQSLEDLDETSIDCIISDYQMPGMTGVEFLESVREQHPHLPFILYTGKGSEEVAAEAFRAGATDYLQKHTGEQYTLLANRVLNAVSEYRAKRAERHLRELAETTDRILYIFNHDWSELLFLNSAYEDIWGRTLEKIRDNPADFLNGIHPDDREMVQENMAKMSAGESITIEYRVNEDEDFSRWVRVRGEPITDDSGTVVRVAGFATEITDEKELQQKLRKRTERLEEAQRVAGVGSWEWDATADEVVWSEETYRIFGWDPDREIQPTFNDWIEAVHPEDREDAQAAVDEAMETGSFPTFEHRLQDPDGGTKWVKCRGNVVTDDDDLVRITGTVMEITDSKRRQQELTRQNERLERFASVVSHDLRSPLSVAEGYLALAQQECESEAIEAVDQAHERMGEIIEDILTLARTGERVKDVDRLPIDQVVSECWQTVQTETATLHVETELPVEADEGRLKRLFENLIRNAIEHGGEDVAVTVGELDSGFYIADDGPGIPRAERDPIFESGYSTTETGTGFGLAIVQEIVDSHGWEIHVTESADGGARFEITGIDGISTTY